MSCDHRIQIHQDDFARTRICMVCYHYSRDDGLTWSKIALTHPQPDPPGIRFMRWLRRELWLREHTDVKD